MGVMPNSLTWRSRSATEAARIAARSSGVGRVCASAAVAKAANRIANVILAMRSPPGGVFCYRYLKPYRHRVQGSFSVAAAIPGGGGRWGRCWWAAGGWLFCGGRGGKVLKTAPGLDTRKGDGAGRSVGGCTKV